MLPDDIWQDATLARKYRPEQTVGTGGMGVVIAARHLELDERVAIKFLLPEAAQSAAALSRFRQEARAAAKIKNEHVVRVIDVAATDAGIPYIVMEYLAGRDLERLLQETAGGRLAVSEAIDFVLQACEALAEAHRLGIVHRDLKPANLFLVERNRALPMIKVLDFGISKLSWSSDDATRTDRHEILGSPRYMSPEQIDAARDVDARADIWSLGVILYEMLAGQPAFSGNVAPELWRRVRTEMPRPLRELRPEVPPALAHVVQKCLEKEPANRYGDIAELATALTPLAPPRSRASLERIQLAATTTRSSVTEISVVPLSRNPTAPEPRAEARRRRRKRVTSTALVLGSVGLGVLFWQKLAVRKNPPGERAVTSSAARLPDGQQAQSTVVVPPVPPPVPSDIASAETNSIPIATSATKLPKARRAPGVPPRPEPEAAAVPSTRPLPPVETTQEAPPASSVPWLVDIATRRKKQAQ